MHKSTHAILIIKNEEEKYLQYFDNRWNSYLFLNIKLTSNNIEEQTLQIKKELVRKLNIKEDTISINLKFDKIHSKYSESAKKDKEYHHYFYNVIIKNLFESNSKINDIEYKWLSIEELENNKRIMEVNSDIINIVRNINKE